MSVEPFAFMRNRACLADVVAHLRDCDDSFVPLLSGRVDLDAYAEKIVGHAERFEAWSSDRLAGFVAVYCNDPQRRIAFVTSVSVLPHWRGGGLGDRLLTACIAHVRQAGFERLELEVDRRNMAARQLYLKHYFRVESTGESAQTLCLQL
jgi:ribosomal protein S18 acetylase RimI-like enzyme